MHGIWVGLSGTVSEDDIRTLLSEWFPKTELMTRDEAVASDRTPWPPIVFSVEETDVADFPFYVSFDCFPGPDDDAVETGAVLAKRLAESCACRAICDGSGWGDNESPYWSIIWQDGHAHMADDSNSDFADGEGGPVRTIRQIDLPAWDLDAEGNLARPDA